jgi:hypothetical protein
MPILIVAITSCSSNGNQASGLSPETQQFCENNKKVQALIIRNFDVKDDNVLTILADMNEWSGTVSRETDNTDSKLVEAHDLLFAQTLKLYSDNSDQTARDEFITISRVIDAYCISAKNS